MQMDNKLLLTLLLDALPLVAAVTGGFATVTDFHGRRIKTVNSCGEDMQSFRGAVYEMANRCAQEQRAMIGPSQIVEGADAWAVPVGPYVVSCSNVERVRREQRLQRALEKALPLIARVAGGEAVIFDHEGKRLSSYNPDGTVNADFLNKVSRYAERAMRTNEPVIGDSFSYTGAMAVRIPITQSYGLGFNNELTAKKQNKLFEEVKKFQSARYNFSDIVGNSDTLRTTISRAKQVSGGRSTILICGETGTGKELFAQAIHNASERRDKPFVAVNSGALPSSLVESCLFGYVDGAFTGAKKGGAPGAFEQADGGTIFLDEISEMDMDTQVKILRVLQEREVTRIGGRKPVRIDVRVLASTNKDLTQMVAEEVFRSDLYYRLNVVQITVPPLRERMSDIALLVNHFILKYNVLLGKYILETSKDALDVLQSYDWPGNVRELQNCVEHAINMVKKDERIIMPHHWPAQIRQKADSIGDSITADASFPGGYDKQGAPTLEQILDKTEERAIRQALSRVNNRKKDAARILGISTTTLWRKMQRYNLQF
jgi:transcriptional regulator with PAS, ATPase and Fis domain